MAYEPVIGLEIHAQLLTASKLFCSCDARYSGASPNSHVCPVDLGLPGSLPVINKSAVEKAIMVGLALSCEIAEVTKFDRKNYPYPDIPKGYQISQYDTPLSTEGHIEFDVGSERHRVGIIRAHLEEDTGKTIHAKAGERDVSLVDYNRSGVPLLEIVSHPDIRSPEAARQYFAELREVLIYLGVCSGDLQEGAMRADINVSVRLPDGELGTKVEIKNLNSFRSVQRSLEYEIRRQVQVLESGGTLIQETRGWDEVIEVTVPQRSKEYAEDYRYFPEPDLPPLHLSRELVQGIREAMPELAGSKRERFVRDYHLSEKDAGVLTMEPALAALMDETVLASPDTEPKIAANWLTGEFLRLRRETESSIEESKISGGNLAELLRLLGAGTITTAIAKTVFEEMFASGKSARDIVSERGLTQIADQGELREIVKQVLDSNPALVKDYVERDRKTEGPLVGQVMKASRGKANAAIVKQIIAEMLEPPQ
jgi:aspartyl-tRNA(Asn)/glutamyl-tRNA(Gln) amidotransferase subunit B